MLWVDKKYLRLISSRFRNSKWKNEDLLNHACPYCGDSEKNPHKARGYHFIYKETFIYKCHNCGESKSFATFLKEQDNTLWKQYCVEKFYKKKPQFAPTVIPTSPQSNLGHKLLEQVGCIKAAEAPKARDYLRHRKIPSHKWDELYYIETVSYTHLTLPTNREV